MLFQDSVLLISFVLLLLIHRHSDDGYHKHRHETFTFDYNLLICSGWDCDSSNAWFQSIPNMPVARDIHTCGVLKRINDDHKILFVTGGWFTYHQDEGYYIHDDYQYDGLYHGMYYDLTLSPDSWNYTMVGTVREHNLEYASISPYEGFVFKNGGGTQGWWIWNERRQDFDRTFSEYPMDSNRHELSVASIPKTSPMVENCL